MSHGDTQCDNVWFIRQFPSIILNFYCLAELLYCCIPGILHDPLNWIPVDLHSVIKSLLDSFLFSLGYYDPYVTRTSVPFNSSCVVHSMWCVPDTFINMQEFGSFPRSFYRLPYNSLGCR